MKAHMYSSHICFIIPYEKSLYIHLAYVHHRIHWLSKWLKGSLCPYRRPLTHLFEPVLLYLFVGTHIISYTFYEYLCLMNASILVFNMLPIYPFGWWTDIRVMFTAFLFVMKQLPAYCMCYQSYGC